MILTRGIRAERPSENVIFSDTQKWVTGDFANMIQNPLHDNFFIISTDDITKTMVRLGNLNSTENPYARITGQGGALIPYTRTLQSYEQLGHEIQVQVETENGHDYQVFNTLTEAEAYLDTLDESDGYILIDEGDTARVIGERVSLWNVEMSNWAIDTNLSISNISRNDNDRY